MPIDDEMTIDERRKYVSKMKPLYDQATRQERGTLLSTMEQVTGMHRKSLTRLLHAESLQRHPRTTQRSRSYGLDVERIVIKVWESLDFICAERLTPTLAKTAQHLARFGMMTVSEETLSQLQMISRATVQRMLDKHRSRQMRLPRSGPTQANRLTKGVPMGRIPWDTKEPDHFEVDLVHHNGSRSAGEYLHTFQMIDVATGWSERVVVLGRSQRAMEAGFRLVLARLPFPVKQIHPDNGTEFFNAHLVRFWGEEITGLTLSRSRPYQKNDNRFVEQKNDTLVRQYFGTLRLEAAHFQEMNSLYEQMWVYYNLFQPVLHLSEKRREGERMVRRWDQAQTPWERVEKAGILESSAVQEMQQLYERTNPARLRTRIHQRVQALWQEPLENGNDHDPLSSQQITAL